MSIDVPSTERDRLRRFAYLLLAPSLGRRRRAGLAYAAVDKALAGSSEPAAVRIALAAEVLRAGSGRTGIPVLARLPRPSRQVGHPVGESEYHLGALIPAARAAYLLVHLEGLDTAETRAVLRAAGVADPETALALAAKCPLDPHLVAEVSAPVPVRVAPRMLAAGVGAAVLGIAAPVIAVTAAGGDDAPAQPTSVERPALRVKDPLIALEASAQKVARKLGRLDQQVASYRGSAAGEKKLRTQHAATAKRLKALNATIRATRSGAAAR
ncbi:MAG: hypothetical protein ACT4QG_12895 [Sporichthyaceae bacterium]